jgi:hypothetical protein
VDRRKDLLEPHVDAPLDLADGEERIDRLSDVVGDPDLLDRHDAGLIVDRKLQRAGQVAVLCPFDSFILIIDTFP